MAFERLKKLAKGVLKAGATVGEFAISVGTGIRGVLGLQAGAAAMAQAGYATTAAAAFVAVPASQIIAAGAALGAAVYLINHFF